MTLPPIHTADARTRASRRPRTMWKALKSFRYQDPDRGEVEVIAGQTYCHMSHPICRKWPDRFMPVNMRDEHRAAMERRLNRGRTAHAIRRRNGGSPRAFRGSLGASHERHRVIGRPVLRSHTQLVGR
jgi:hypothetical protein